MNEAVIKDQMGMIGQAGPNALELRMHINALDKSSTSADDHSSKPLAGRSRHPSSSDRDCSLERTLTEFRLSVDARKSGEPRLSDLFSTVCKQVKGTSREPVFNRFLTQLVLVENEGYEEARVSSSPVCGEDIKSESCRLKSSGFWDALDHFLHNLEGREPMVVVSGGSQQQQRSNNKNSDAAKNTCSTGRLSIRDRATCSPTTPPPAPPPPPPPPPPLPLSLLVARSTSSSLLSSSSVVEKQHCSNSSRMHIPREPLTEKPLDEAQSSPQKCPWLANGHSEHWSGVPAPPKAPPDLNATRAPPSSRELTPSRTLPTPSVKLRSLPWHKVPSMRVTTGRDNVWAQGAREFDSDFMPDLSMLEELFSAGPPPVQSSLPCSSSSTSKGSDCSSNVTPPGTLDRKDSGGSCRISTLERRLKETTEINLLDAKRSINVNIFLKQFRGGVAELANSIRSNKAEDIGAEKLRSMIKILPEPDEVETLNAFAGDRSKLGDAERFFLHLLEIPNYRLRVEAMLLKTEFASIVEAMKPSVEVMIKAAKELMKNSALPELLYIVLLVGNYLNTGAYSGNAFGFRLVSLWNLFELRANRPDVTLLHCVAAEAERKNTALLLFSEQLPNLQKASKLSMDALLADYRCLQERIGQATAQVTKCDNEQLFNEISLFLESAKKELKAVDSSLKQLEQLRVQVAEFFCEEVQPFKLEDCFKVIASFQSRFAQAVQENAERKSRDLKRTSRAAEAGNGSLPNSKASSPSLSRHQCSASISSYSSSEKLRDKFDSGHGKSGFHWMPASCRKPIRHQSSFASLLHADRERPRRPSIPNCLDPNSIPGGRLRRSGSGISILSGEFASSGDLDSANTSGLSDSAFPSVPKVRVQEASFLRQNDRSSCSSSGSRRVALQCRIAADGKPNDLNEFLELLEAEKEQMEWSLYGRRYRMSADLSASKFKRTSSPAELVSMGSSAEAERRVTVPLNDHRLRTDIDQVVIHCENACTEIDRLGVDGQLPLDASWTSSGKSLRDSGISDMQASPRDELSNGQPMVVGQGENPLIPARLESSLGRLSEVESAPTDPFIQTAQILAAGKERESANEAFSKRDLARNVVSNKDLFAHDASGGRDPIGDGDDGFETASTLSNEHVPMANPTTVSRVEAKKSSPTNERKESSPRNKVVPRYMAPTKSVTSALADRKKKASPITTHCPISKSVPTSKVSQQPRKTRSASSAPAVARLRNGATANTVSSQIASKLSDKTLAKCPANTKDDGSVVTKGACKAIDSRARLQTQAKRPSNSQCQSSVVESDRPPVLQDRAAAVNKSAASTCRSVRTQAKNCQITRGANAAAAAGNKSSGTARAKSLEAHKTSCGTVASSKSAKQQQKDNGTSTCGDKRWERLKSPPKTTLTAHKAATRRAIKETVPSTAITTGGVRSSKAVIVKKTLPPWR
ncbi:FH2 domain containing protein [Trichuris trichiura]|uniref:FH2 domain containing protein n=1 Tax=Trichuris trichiura TaxID=36087 RepID=A0A077Z4L7_TRITR|nr:FH2 domain containing protein [Trichuris trichiura]